MSFDDSRPDEPLIASVGSPEDLADAFLASLERDPRILGAADLYLLDYAAGPVRVAAMAAAISGVALEDGRRAIQKYAILVPSGSDPNALQATIRDNFGHAMVHLTKGTVDPRALEWFQSRIVVEAAADLRISRVVDFVTAQPDHTAVLLMDAGAYRDDGVPPAEPEIEGGLRQQADFWAPQLHALAEATTSVIKGRAVYVAIDSGVGPPARETLMDQLLSVDGCGVMSGTAFESQKALERGFQEWEALIKEGRLGEALRLVDALPPSLDRQKPVLRIQLLARGGQLNLALQELRARLAAGPAPDSSIAVIFARTAYDAGSDRLARELLAPLPTQLTDRDDLRRAVDTAERLDARSLVEAFAERLRRLFPDDAYLAARHREALAEAGDYAGLAALTGDPLHRLLAKHLTGDAMPDYDALIAEASDDRSRLALRLTAADDALKRNHAVEAFDVLEGAAPAADQQSAFDQRLLKVLKVTFLTPAVNAAVGDDRIAGALERLIRSLAANPDKSYLRVGLARLLSPTVAGLGGLSLLVMLVLTLPDASTRFDRSRLPEKSGIAWLGKRKAFIRAMFDWLQTQAPVVIGQVKAPLELITEPADKVVAGVADYIRIAETKDQSDVVRSRNGWP